MAASPRQRPRLRSHGVTRFVAKRVASGPRCPDALLALEHGGAAVLMLNRLQQGLADGKRRPIPGRTLAPLRPPDGDGVA